MKLLIVLFAIVVFLIAKWTKRGVSDMDSKSQDKCLVRRKI